MKRKTTQALLAIGAIVLGLLVIGAVAAVAAPKPGPQPHYPRASRSLPRPWVWAAVPSRLPP